MSAQSQPTSTPAPASTSSTSAASQSSGGGGGSSGDSFDSNTQVSSLSDLKDKAPALYKAMMQGIAMNIVFDMQHQQDRFKRIWDEGLQDFQ